MKSAITLVTVLVVIGAGYFFLENYWPDDPFGKDDAYKLEVATPGGTAVGNMRVTNRTGMNLRLHVFYASDRVKAIAKYNDILKAGSSKTYPRDSYVINLWKSQLFDRHLKWTGPLWGNVVLRGGENDLRVDGRPRPPVTITNTVDEQLKICAYDVADTVRWIPLTPCWDLARDRKVEWGDAPKVFTIKVFRPAALDVALVTQSHIPELSALVIRKQGPF
jgi:hypothetical protein